MYLLMVILDKYRMSQIFKTNKKKITRIGRFNHYLTNMHIDLLDSERIHLLHPLNSGTKLYYSVTHEREVGVGQSC